MSETVDVREAAAGASLESLLRLQQLGRATAVAGGVYRDGFEILRTVVKSAEGMG
jgi:hypothetical protein